MIKSILNGSNKFIEHFIFLREIIISRRKQRETNSISRNNYTIKNCVFSKIGGFAACGLRTTHSKPQAFGVKVVYFNQLLY
jgi:hypothetical protein